MNRRFLLVAIFCIGSLVIPNLFGYPPAAATSNITETELIRDAFDPELYKKLNTVDALVEHLNTSYKGSKNYYKYVRRQPT